MRITVIVAVADNGIIGQDGRLPWRLPGDMAHFKATTMGHPVIMGRKTFQSIGKPLPGRTNIVITRHAGFDAGGAVLADSFQAALAAAGQAGEGADEAFVIGGAQIYDLALPRADRIILTEVHATPDGDTSFPAQDQAEWREVTREDAAADGAAPAYSIVTLDRRRPPDAPL